MDEGNAHIEVKKIADHWIQTSEDDAETMMILYNSKSYGWSLFLGQISVEKLLKALYVKKFGKHAPFTHNLLKLAKLVNIEMSSEQLETIDKITSFNLNARYDDYKKEFYQVCTQDFTQEWIDKITILRKWIKQQF
ncbi:MAG TPA: HEPN domain-containing protein [Leeuwenhoekiella sp.]|nr:HEPN domain-containing protein [Leeuwenhoekiella sp.]